MEVKKGSDRIASLKMEIRVLVLNAVSAYAPHVGGQREEKGEFWKKMDKVEESIMKSWQDWSLE